MVLILVGLSPFRGEDLVRLLDSINSSSCHSSFLCPPLSLLSSPNPPILSNTFRPMILDEQSQKQNELEQPRWEQMARNCLVEEARESIFTRPGGVAVARRKKKVQVHLFWSAMAWRKHLKNIHHTHIRKRSLTKALWVRPGMQWWVFIRAKGEMRVWVKSSRCIAN